MLSTTDHSRDAAGLTYVYPVLSRRSGGLSIGINLNPNNACNWRCVYCQVPELKRGSAPAINISQLEDELEFFLETVISGEFYEQQSVPEHLRHIKDIAFSGNGEPTTARDFHTIVESVASIKGKLLQDEKIKTVLISNGSMMHKHHVREGLKSMAHMHGEVWFKIDATNRETVRQINNVSISEENTLSRLEMSVNACPTWIQSCFFQWHNTKPSDDDVNHYLRFLEHLKNEQLGIEGVLLYTTARPSLQPEAGEISAVDAEWLEKLRDNIIDIGFEARASV